MDDDWPAVLSNIRKARQVWGCIGNFMRGEGEDPSVSEKFYHVVVQSVLLFGAETWVMLAPMAKKLKGLHVGFLQQLTRMKGRRLKGGSWRKALS